MSFILKSERLTCIGVVGLDHQQWGGRLWLALLPSHSGPCVSLSSHTERAHLLLYSSCHISPNTKRMKIDTNTKIVFPHIGGERKTSPVLACYHFKHNIIESSA